MKIRHFLSFSSFAVAALMIFGAVSAAAVPASFGFNAPTGSPSSYIDFDDNNCPSSTLIAPGGNVTNGGSGLSLYGQGSIQGYGEMASCYMAFYWTGTGQGLFPGTTATVTPDVTFSVPADVTISSCTLTVSINGTQEKQITCSIGSGGVFSLPAQSFPVPTTLSTYQVVLAINAQWTDTQRTILTVNVPGETSIDLLAQAALPGTPAPSTLILTMLGIVLLAMIGFAMTRRKAAGSL